jgi:hypothetical protein
MSVLRNICIAFLLLSAAMPAMGQNEAALRSFFEGKRVALKIDMPATSDGVDIRVGTEVPLDYKIYGKRLAETGTAIRAGESSLVTTVHVKKDLIEFQLGGGGFGYESSSVYVPSIDKSNREKDLEKQIKAETDAAKKRGLQRELEDLSARRERENARISIERTEVEEQKKARIALDRLQAGSRFNLRYNKSVPQDITPQDIMAVLADYVDFASGLPHKGMLRSEVEEQLGRPVNAVDRKEGSLTVTRLTFFRGKQRIVADFVEDVLFRYTITAE